MKPYEYSFVIKRADGSADVFPVEFSRSLNTKNIKITPVLSKKIVKVSYPVYVLKSRALSFLESQKEWIAKQLQKIPQKTVIENGAVITFLEKEYKIVNVVGAKRGVWIEDSYIFVSGNNEFLNRRVKDFLKAEIKKYFSTKARYYSSKLGKSFTKITVKDTSSRWGSCASNGNISLSWRLGFAPKYVIDYVIVHEVAHLQEFNHSVKFWKIVSDLYGESVEDAKKWLCRNGASLYSID